MHLINSRRNYHPISILHTADIHLPGSSRYYLSNDLNPALDPYRVLEAVVKTANMCRVELVLISGDLFDDYHPTQEAVHRAIQIMADFVPPVVIIPGNHDALGEAETFHLPLWDNGFHPYVIKKHDGEVLEIPDIPLLVWGRAMVEHSPDFLPLEGIPVKQKGVWHVAMAHGFYYTRNETGGRSSPIYDSDISNSGWDYIALGHNHIYRDISHEGVKAAYAGSPVAGWKQDTKVVVVNLDGRRTDPVLLRRVDVM